MVQPKNGPTGPVTLKICTGPIRSGPGPLGGAVKLKNADNAVTYRRRHRARRVTRQTPPPAVPPYMRRRPAAAIEDSVHGHQRAPPTSPPPPLHGCIMGCGNQRERAAAIKGLRRHRRRRGILHRIDGGTAGEDLQRQWTR